MTGLLATWLGVGIAITAAARRWLNASWRRAVGGASTWPLWPAFTLTSWLKWRVRQRKAEP